MSTDAPQSFDDVQQALEVKRRAAQRKVHFGRIVQRQGADMEREGTAELADVEAFERVLRSLPSSRQEIAALEHNDPAHLLHRTEQMLMQLRSEAVHADPKQAQVWRSERSQREQVLAASRHILGDGSWRSTEELLAALQSLGVQLTSANPAMRISQILSQSNMFKTQRGWGWALVTSPGPDSLPESESEEQLRIQARRLVSRDDHRGRG